MLTSLDFSALVTACALLLGAGYVVVGVLALIGPVAARARSVFPVLVTETIIVAVAVASLATGGLVLRLMVVLLAFRICWEAAVVAFKRDGGARFSRPLTRALAPGAGALAFVVGSVPIAAVAPAAAIIALACAGVLLVAPRRKIPAGILAELALFPILPVIVFAAAASKPDFAALLLAAFILVETFDSYALLGGKLFGRHPAFPVLSPKKTVEGLAAGAVMLMLTAALAGSYLAGLKLWTCLFTALAAGILAVVGDLAGSRLKRRSGVKDYPEVLPHQGGLLDIVDAWIVAGAGLALFASLQPLL